MKALIFPAKEDAGDVLVIELGGGPRFLVKAQDVFRIGRHFRRQDFQGYGAVELRIARPNDGRHTTHADWLDQLEMGQAAAPHIIGKTIFRAGAAYNRGSIVGIRTGRSKERTRRHFRRITLRAGSESDRRHTFLGVGWSLGTCLGS